MDGELIAVIVMAGAGVVTGAYSIWRNGRKQHKDYGQLEQKVEDLKTDIIKDENHGLSALNKNVAKMRENCARHMGIHSEKISKLEEVVFGKRKAD